MREANIRKDAAHKLTTDLTRRFETIVIEDLNVSGMAKNHGLAGAVPDCGLHEIRRQLQYKQPMRGGCIVIANRFFPSTQTCSCCGCLTGPKGREGLGRENWVCSECGAAHARDGNAAINLRKLGLAEAEVTRGDMAPLPAWASVTANTVANAEGTANRNRAHLCAHLGKQTMSEDPIIEAIRLHQAADQRLDQLDDTVGADEDASQAAADAEHAAFWALFKTPPTSLAGFQELFAYLGRKREFGDCLLSHAIDYWSDGPDHNNEHHPDEATWMRTLADAMARIRLLRGDS
jgi:IS605 OrfB family transposase